MKRLALDSAQQPPSLALQQGDEILAQTLEGQKAGAEGLVVAIEKMMKKADMKFCDLDEIIVSTGPGAFIGLRIGLAAALGISIAAQKPIKSIPSFLVHASFAEPKDEDDIILVHQPARKNFTAFQTFDKKRVALSALQCVRDENFKELFSKQDNICFVSPAPAAAAAAPSEILAARLIKLAALAKAGAEPIYPPNEARA